MFADLNEQLQVQLADFKDLMEVVVLEFNQLVRDHDIPAIWLEDQEKTEPDDQDKTEID